MLVETHPGGEREIGADPHEHGSPVAIVDIEIILIHPAPLHLEMPVLLLADGLQDAGGFPRFDNGDHLIGRRFGTRTLFYGSYPKSVISIPPVAAVGHSSDR